jgi:hypothetical protein
MKQNASRIRLLLSKPSPLLMQERAGALARLAHVADNVKVSRVAAKKEFSVPLS